MAADAGSAQRETLPTPMNDGAARIERLRARAELPALRQHLADDLLPLAHSLGVLSQSDGVVELVQSQSATSHGKSDVRTPKQEAHRLLAVVASFLSVEMNEDHPEALLMARIFIHEVRGYLYAMDDVRHQTARRGAAGRRLIGSTSRDRVRKAAQQFRGDMSKERAATLIADIVGKSPATVRKLLTALYPGSTWANVEHEESTDVAG